MIKRLILFAAVAALAVPTESQHGTASARQVKSGEVVKLGDNLAVKVTQPAKSPFPGVKVKGEPLVVVLELDAGTKGLSLSYKLSADFKLSDVYLAGGTSRLGPLAVIEDFPSWGTDNDKEVDVLDSKQGGGSTLDFEGKGFISLLFDVPPALAKTPKKLSIILRTVKPVDQQHSIVVSM